MSRILTIDIGAGTMDVLYYDTSRGVHYKAVVKSPVLSAAQRAESAQDILVLGTEMGGGAFASALKSRAGRTGVLMSSSSCRTVHQDPERVRSYGIDVVSDEEAEKLKSAGQYTVLESCDLQVPRLESIVRGFDVDFSFDVVGICAQDHGLAPEGMSHLDTRHYNFSSVLDVTPFPSALLYRIDEIPSHLTRLKVIAQTASSMNTGEIYVMDSGMSAVLGALMDREAAARHRCLVMDVATSHTIGAAFNGGELYGFFEYHTRDVSCRRIEILLQKLADGTIEHKTILSEGGHGAYVRKSFGFDNTDMIVATGPRRGILEGSSLAIHYGAPLGDNMMTGTVGLVEAIRRRKKLPEIDYR